MTDIRFHAWDDNLLSHEASDAMMRESTSSGKVIILVDIIEAAGEYLVEASVPGASPENLHIQVQGNQLWISGVIEPAQQGEWLQRERGLGRFERLLRLPSEIQANLAAAELRNGVLLIRLPKATTSAAVVRQAEEATTRDALALAGAWSDLDWEQVEEALDQIRHRNPPSAPLSL